MSLSPVEVAAILDYDLTVLVGRRDGHEHRLFFSVPDEQCFVAVQDPVQGAIVTVLPLDYHATLAWTVSEDAQRQSKAVLREGRRSGQVTFATGSSGADSGFSLGQRRSSSSESFKVGCYFENGLGNLRAKTLGSVPFSRVGGRLAGLLETEDVLKEIEELAEGARRSGERLAMLFVRASRNQVLRIQTVT